MGKFFRSTVFASIIAPFITGPSVAQPLTWWDILSPDRLIEHATRYAVVFARTYVDLTFEDISTNLLSSRTTISNLQIWPPIPWQDRELCKVSIERVTISGQTFDNLDNATVKLDAYDAMVTLGCVPPELRTGTKLIGLEEISLPSININISYHIPSAQAKVSILASMSDIMEASLAADFDYVAFRVPVGRGDPHPVAFLSSSSIEFHNLGGWEAVSQFLPGAFTEQETAAAAVENAIRAAFNRMNRKSVNSNDEELSIFQLAFLSTVASAWTEFLKSPDQIVLETNIAPDRPVFLNFWEYEDSPSSIIRDLNPTMRTATSSAPNVLSADAIDALVSGGWRDLPTTMRLEIGVALARGEGVPQNGSLAVEILTELATEGNGKAAAAISEALENIDPEAAYRWSLSAGISGEVGMTSRLDRLEAELPVQTILKIQRNVSIEVKDKVTLPSSIVGVRARARNHLTGIGARRDYQTAHTWASIGAALGDHASVAIADEVSKTLNTANTVEGKAAIDELLRNSNDAALGLWSELIPVLNARGGPSDTARRPVVQSPAEAIDTSTVSDDELNTCRQLFTERFAEDYEVGGNCVSNSAVLLRELALAGKELDSLRGRLTDNPAIETEESLALTEPDVELPEAELLDDRPVVELAVEPTVVMENVELKRELEASTSKLAEGERQVALLNEQVSALRSQLGSLQSLLDATSSRDQETQVQIEALGSELNTALARVVLAERQRQELETTQQELLRREAERPPSDAEIIQQFRAQFLTDLEDVHANRSDITVVDDRLIISSGTLFQKGSTNLSAEGRAEIAKVAGSFINIAAEIPTSADWILRIGGHTDDIPIASSAFADNWELSQARALSVLRYLADDLAFPPHRLAAMGFGEYQPLNSENTAAARAQNRRIELLLTTR
ncbi:MAG: OmpA family protein [Paracoccaceae bacterium]